MATPALIFWIIIVTLSVFLILYRQHKLLKQKPEDKKKG